MYVYTCVRNVCVYVCMYVCMYVCVCVCMCTYPTCITLLCDATDTSYTCSVCASSMCPAGTYPNNQHAFPGSDAYLLLLFPECMIFYGVAAATYVFFLRLARDWPQLLVQWSSLEQTQRRYGTPRYLRCKIRCVTAALLCGAAGIRPNHLVLVSNVVSFHDSAFDSWQRQECVPLPIVQPGCGAHVACYLICRG